MYIIILVLVNLVVGQVIDDPRVSKDAPVIPGENIQQPQNQPQQIDAANNTATNQGLLSYYSENSESSSSSLLESSNRTPGLFDDARSRASAAQDSQKKVDKATRILVDFALNVEVLTAILKDHILTTTEKGLFVNSLRAFFKPLETYRNAQAQEDIVKLSSSLKNVLRLLNLKEGSTRIDQSDFEPGQLWTTVVRKNDVEAVLKGRENMFLLVRNQSDSLRLLDNDYRSKSLDYLSDIPEDSDRFTALISPSISFRDYLARYIECIEKILLVRSEMVDKVRDYLAIYLKTGRRNDGEFDQLVREASQFVKPPKSQSAGFSFAQNLTPFNGLTVVAILSLLI